MHQYVGLIKKIFMGVENIFKPNNISSNRLSAVISNYQDLGTWIRCRYFFFGGGHSWPNLSILFKFPNSLLISFCLYLVYYGDCLPGSGSAHFHYCLLVSTSCLARNSFVFPIVCSVSTPIECLTLEILVFFEVCFFFLRRWTGWCSELGQRLHQQALKYRPGHYTWCVIIGNNDQSKKLDVMLKVIKLSITSFCKWSISLTSVNY